MDNQPSQLKPPPPRRSGVVTPNAPKWHQRLAAGIVRVCEGLLVMTLRCRWEDRSGMFTGPELRPVIFCTWHNRLALAMHIFRNYIRKQQPARNLAALVSASKDGALLAAILESFDVRPVRGSSSRRGAQALLEMTSWNDRGFDLAITPDGPRGPCYKIQDGVLAVAQVTGLPIVPSVYRASWKIRLKSWDRFQIPLPFSRCDFYFGEPLVIPREATDAEREELRKELERRMAAITFD